MLSNAYLVLGFLLVSNGFHHHPHHTRVGAGSAFLRNKVTVVNVYSMAESVHLLLASGAFIQISWPLRDPVEHWQYNFQITVFLRLKGVYSSTGCLAPC